MQRHLARGDAPHAERVEERAPLGPELLHERVVGALPAEGVAGERVDVRHGEVDVLLPERVEGRALLEDAPELDVDALDVGLLRRAVRVAEERLHAARHELRRVVGGVRPVHLDHHRVAELRAVGDYQKFLITDIIRNLALSGISDAA